MRTVRLTWKQRVTKKKKAAILKWIRLYYSTARDRGDYVELHAGKQDTKFIWLFMFSKTFNDME